MAVPVMTILFCYATILVVAVTTVFLIGSVLWHKAVAIFGFEVDDAGEEFDDTEAWDRGHDEWIDRQAGVL